MAQYTTNYKGYVWEVIENSYMVDDQFVSSISVRLPLWDAAFHNIVSFDLQQEGRQTLFREIERWIDEKVAGELSSGLH